ncbi:DUF4209 domain-containing protein [Desulfoplanes sp.]
MLFEEYLKSGDARLVEVFAVHEQSRSDAFECLSPSVLKVLGEDDLLQIEEKALRFGLDCEQAMAALLLWLGRGGKNQDMCISFVQAMQNYFDSCSWYDDEPLVLHFVLNSFSYYFPLRSLKHCSDEDKREVDSLVRCISNHIHERIGEKFDLTSLCEYWVLKALYPLFDTRKGNVPGLDHFQNVVQELFSCYIKCDDLFHAEWIIRDMQECKALCWPDLNANREQLALSLLQNTENDCSLRGLIAARQAAAIFEKISDRPAYDQAMCVVRDITENLTFDELYNRVPDELQAMLDKRRKKSVQFLEQEKKRSNCFDCLEVLFGTVRFPSKSAVQESASNGLPLSYHIAQIQTMTKGRQGTVGCSEKEDEKQKELESHWACSLYLHQLPVVTILDIENIWCWICDNFSHEEIRDAFLAKYQASILYETTRSALVADMGKRLCEGDWGGFLYPAVLQIEHFLRLFLHKTGHNVSAGNLKKIENITMGSLLRKFEDQISAQFGDDFWYFLWMMFGYEHGPNVRNALAHGLGIPYLNFSYGMLFMHALGYLWHHAPLVVGVRTKEEGKGNRQ